MKIVFNVVGEVERPPLVVVDLPTAPRLEEQVTFANGNQYHVRTVVWYLQGDEDDNTPFVYVVVGPRP